MGDNNHFRVGIALTDFLRTLKKDDEPLFKRVEFLQSLNDVSEQKNTTPACYVIYQGESVVDMVGGGECVQVEQRYSVIIAISHASSQDNAYDGVQMAGEIIPLVLQALQGKIITPNSTRLKRMGSDQAGFSHVFSYYPFTFGTKLII